MRIGLFKLASCSGCIVSFVDALSREPELINKIRIVSPFFDDKYMCEYYDMVFIEGSVSRQEDIKLLKEVRNRSKYLIVLGSCGLYGGIQKISSNKNKPVSHIVKTDYVITGCPVDGDRVYVILKKLLIGGLDIKIYESVCSECKRSNNTCILVLERKPCLGPLTRAGCKAICPAYGRGCIGCNGLRPDLRPEHVRKYIENLRRKGIDLGVYELFIKTLTK